MTRQNCVQGQGIAQRNLQYPNSTHLSYDCAAVEGRVVGLALLILSFLLRSDRFFQAIDGCFSSN